MTNKNQVIDPVAAELELRVPTVIPLEVLTLRFSESPRGSIEEIKVMSGRWWILMTVGAFISVCTFLSYILYTNTDYIYVYTVAFFSIGRKDAESYIH